MPDKTGNGVWKWICGVLAAVLLTGLTSWLSFGGSIGRSEATQIAEHAADDVKKSVPSRKEVSKMIQTESPYVIDKSGIDARLQHIEEMLVRIERRVHQ